MTPNENLKQKYMGLLKKPLILHDIIHCNYRPHPYMIGPRHVAHASDHCGGKLGEETCKKIQCALAGCTICYDDHKSDYILVLKLTRTVTQEEIKAQITPAFGDSMKTDGLDGLVFLKQADYKIQSL